MILFFPDTDTVRLVLEAGFLPPSAAMSPALLSFAPDGRIAVETEAKLSKKVINDLSRLGVLGAKKHPGPTSEITCWAQILPVTREPSIRELASQAPVLFELESTDDLPILVTEMLRLGNDRQGVRWLESAEGSSPRILLRVIGPPYYTLLRAIESTTSGTKGTVRAYVEVSPSVWVQLGYTHPLADRIKPAEGQSLFIRSPRDWVTVPDGTFTDLYEVVRFDLPGQPTIWADQTPSQKFHIPLRLVPGTSTEAAEMWVLRDNAVEQLDRFVRDADERIIQRIKFSVATSATGETVVVLQVSNNRTSPPILPLTGAIAYKPYVKLPNLYIPVGRRLHPTLRRDVVRTLLASDPDRLVWLEPTEGDDFRPEMIPIDSFRPLEDWVDYIVGTNAEPLTLWINATTFEFDHFLCSETPGNKPKPDDGPDRGKRRNRPDRPEQEVRLDAAPETRPIPDAPSALTPLSDPPPAPQNQPIQEWKRRREELENAFLAAPGDLDTSERRQLWPMLAEANQNFGDTTESAICWLNAMWGPKPDTARESTWHQQGWDRGQAPPIAWVESWLQSELPDKSPEALVSMLEGLLKQEEPTANEMRHFGAAVLGLTYQSPVPTRFRQQLPAIQRYLVQHERLVPIRIAWLAALRLAALTGSDTLGLARCRDRILQRLLEEGLNAETEMPKFLRNAGRHDSERIRQVQEGMLDLHAVVRQWAETSLKQPTTSNQSDQNATLAYIDLIFAHGLARLGESSPARDFVEKARRILTSYPAGEDRALAGDFLFRAFQWRIEQVFQGKSNNQPLHPDLLSELEGMAQKSNGQANTPFGLAHYVINRMRQQSLILDPQEKLDPYLEHTRHGDDLNRQIFDLVRVREPAVFARRARDLIRGGSNGKSTPEQQLQVLLGVLPLASRAGEQLTLDLIQQIPVTMQALAAVKTPIPKLAENQGRLLERAIFLAAHFDRRETVQQLTDLFVDLVQSKSGDQRFEIVNVVAGQSLRSLRKLGLKEETATLLRRLQQAFLQGGTIAELRQRYQGPADPRQPFATSQWSKVLQSLLHLAGGWLACGLPDQALVTLNEARQELLGPRAELYSAKDYTPLAQAAIAALGYGPMDLALPRIREFFEKSDPRRVTNSWTTSKFFSRFHLNLVEETLSAVVNDDLALGPAGRRWLDEDEYLIRRRIHWDMHHGASRSDL